MTAEYAPVDETVQTHIMGSYSPKIAAGIGALMPQLDESFSAEPMTEQHFEAHFAGRSDRAILVATRAGKVIGTAVMNTLVEQAPEAMTGYMGGFVVDEAARGSGAATAMWRQMKRWCIARNLPSFSFNTETYREQAIGFYRKMGAQLVPGTDTHYTVPIAEQAHPGVPAEVVDGFLGHAAADIQPLGEGLVNRTFLAETDKERRVLQQLNPVFDEAAIADNAAVAEHMTTSGWKVAQTLPVADGESWLRDNDGNLWRQLSYIESDGRAPEQLDKFTLRAVGRLLARWHGSLRTMDYEPQFTLPHFHDTDHHMDRLRELQAGLPDQETQTLAEQVLKAHARLAELPDTAPQLIHGDPQLTNILFQGGQPFTYIDLDTTMRGSIWLDIGDLLRATMEDDLKNDRPLDTTKVLPIIEGYFRRSSAGLSETEFTQAALAATQQIALELASRFLNDIVDDSYFEWDDSRYASRRDNHLARADMQWQIHEALAESKR